MTTVKQHLTLLLGASLSISDKRTNLDELYSKSNGDELLKNKDDFYNVLEKYIDSKDPPSAYITIMLCNLYYNTLFEESLKCNNNGWTFTNQFISSLMIRMKNNIEPIVKEIQNLLSLGNSDSGESPEHSIFFWVKSLDTIVSLHSSIMERIESFYPISMAMARQLFSISLVFIRMAKSIKDFSKPFKTINLEFGDQTFEKMAEQLSGNIDKNILLLKNVTFTVQSFQLSTPQNQKHLVDYCQDLLQIFQEGIDSNQPVKLNIYKAFKNIFTLDCEGKFDICEKIDIRSTLTKILKSCKENLNSVLNQPDTKNLRLSTFYINTTQMVFESFSSKLDNETLSHTIISFYDLYSCFYLHSLSMDDKKKHSIQEYNNKINDLSTTFWKFGTHERILQELQKSNNSSNQIVGKLLFILSTFGSVTFKDQSSPYTLFRQCFLILEQSPIVLEIESFTQHLLDCFGKLFISSSIASSISLYRYLLKNIISNDSDYVVKLSMGVWMLLYNLCDEKSKQIIDTELIVFMNSLNNRMIFNVMLKKKYLCKLLLALVYDQKKQIILFDHFLKHYLSKILDHNNNGNIGNGVSSNNNVDLNNLVPFSAIIYLGALGLDQNISLSSIVKEKIIELLDYCFTKLKHCLKKSTLSIYELLELENMVSVIESISSIDISLLQKNNIIENITPLLNLPLLYNQSIILHGTYGSLTKLTSILSYKQINDILTFTINCSSKNDNSGSICSFLSSLANNSASLQQIDQNQLHSTLQQIFTNLFNNNSSWVITCSIESTINSFSSIFNNRSKLASLIPQDNRLRDKFINNQSWFAIPNLLPTKEYLQEQSSLNQQFSQNIEQWKENNIRQSLATNNNHSNNENGFGNIDGGNMVKTQMDLMQSRGTSPVISIGEDITSIKKMVSHIKQSLVSKPKIDDETKRKYKKSLESLFYDLNEINNSFI